MYISNIKIQNYRGFQSLSVGFRDGINILIGPNNSGKSNLLKALSIIFDGKSRKQLTVADFYNGIQLEDLKKHSPKITITVMLSQSENENLLGDELVTVSNWLIKLDEPYLAQLQYEFFLPEEYESAYKKSIENLSKEIDIWEKIESSFIRLYIHKIWAGYPENQIQVDNDSLSRFDFQFMDAIRDVERDMFSGKNALLKDIIDFFLDYDIKSDKNLSQEMQNEQINNRKDDFKNNSDKLIEVLKSRLQKGTKEILSYVDHIGASFDHSKPTFEGVMNESEVYSILKLLVQQETGMNIPIGNNGLGYNNLIFMSLLLAKMQIDSDGSYLGSNAKVFPILAIEEPEAHLHPTMQFQFVKFLKDNLQDKKVKQVFITSHSTHITSSAQLDDLICLNKIQNSVNVSYPGKVFPLDQEKNESKKYVQRFLDATKSNMLFAERIIMVEGIAEQLLIPVFANYLGKNLEENHVAVINVGGRYFNHFLYLFDSSKQHTINRKIACITDVDPMRKKIEGSNNHAKKCYPYEYDIDTTEYTYKQNKYLEDYEENKHPNIQAFTQDRVFGKTLEYQIAFDNPDCKLLITPSMRNQAELKELMNAFKEKRPLSNLIEILNLNPSNENSRITTAIQQLPEKWAEIEKKKAIIASRYLNSVEKGENALELATCLQEKYIENPEEVIKDFNIPNYIKNAIEWVCDKK